MSGLPGQPVDVGPGIFPAYVHYRPLSPPPSEIAGKTASRRANETIVLLESDLRGADEEAAQTHVVGRALDLEYSLRGMAEASGEGVYAKAMSRRVRSCSLTGVWPTV